MSEETTPKQRYDARMKLKRQASEPGHKSDELVTAEYAMDLAERFVSAFELFARSFSRKSF